MSKIAMVCATCGSFNVVRDAWAQWDDEAQKWVLAGDPFDYGMCSDCEDEKCIEEIDLDAAAAYREYREAMELVGEKPLNFDAYQELFDQP